RLPNTILALIMVFRSEWKCGRSGDFFDRIGLDLHDWKKLPDLKVRLRLYAYNKSYAAPL
ncbi:hypothetical protein KI387_002933, partial [Taxus chinensis]